MAPPKLGNLAIKVTIVGHASRRWKGAKSAAEADRLNQALSEHRAQNIYGAVDKMLKSEIAGLAIPTMWKGVGSHEGFPTAGDDNAPVDRSVVVMVDLTTTTPSYKFQPQPPRKIYLRSKVWTLRVIEMVRGAAFGFVEIFLRVGVTNPYTGREIIMTGWLSGGGSAMDVKDSFKIPSMSTLIKNTADMWKGQIGNKVSFTTDEAMDFDDWNNGGQGHLVRLGKIDVSLGLRSYDTYLKFLDPRTTELFFQHKFLTLGKIKADAFLVSGKLHTEGDTPSDYLELPSPADIIPTQSSRNHQQGLLLTFPTGKAGLNDLTEKDRQDLQNFVANRAHVISDLADNFQLTN